MISSSCFTAVAIEFSSLFGGFTRGCNMCFSFFCCLFETVCCVVGRLGGRLDGLF